MRCTARRGDYPDGKQGDVLTVEFTVMGIPCVGLNGGPTFKPDEAFSFQVATDDQAETDRLWNAIVGNGGQESACGWCKDKWGVSWQITPRVLLEAFTDPDRGRGQARVRRDDDHAEDRHRDDREGVAGLRFLRPPPGEGHLTVIPAKAGMTVRGARPTGSPHARG